MLTQNLIVVCSADNPVLHKIQNRSIVLQTNDLTQVKHAEKIIKENNSTLYAIYAKLDTALDEVDFSIELPNVKIVCSAPKLGAYKEFRKQREEIDKKKLLFLFPPTTADSYTNAKILSTLGLQVGIKLNEDAILWQDLIDLLYHTNYSQASHKVVEPIHQIVEGFRQNEGYVFGSLYFENQNKFIHIDANENIALSERALRAGDYISTGIDSLSTEAFANAFQQQKREWHNEFIEHKKCATCKAWRVCAGQYIKYCDNNDGGPVEFFNEIINMIAEQKSSGEYI